MGKHRRSFTQARQSAESEWKEAGAGVSCEEGVGVGLESLS